MIRFISSWYRLLEGERKRLVPGEGIRIHLEAITLLHVNPADAGTVFLCAIVSVRQVTTGGYNVR